MKSTSIRGKVGILSFSIESGFFRFIPQTPKSPREPKSPPTRPSSAKKRKSIDVKRSRLQKQQEIEQDDKEKATEPDKEPNQETPSSVPQSPKSIMSTPKNAKTPSPPRTVQVQALNLRGYPCKSDSYTPEAPPILITFCYRKF